MAEYADIIVDISLGKLDRTFQYRIPPALTGQIRPGVLVEVPFGNGSRRIRGYVVEVTDGLRLKKAASRRSWRLWTAAFPSNLS